MLFFIIILGLVTLLAYKQIQVEKSKLSQDYEQKLNAIKNEQIKQINDIQNKQLDKTNYKVKQSLNRARLTLKGNISEIFCPFHKGFPYLAADCTFTGKPIDYIIFNNLEAYRDGKKTIDDLEIIFVEVKSSQHTSLSPVQEGIRHAVNNGKVRFETYKYDAKTIEQSKIAISKIEETLIQNEPLKLLDELSELDAKYDKCNLTDDIRKRRETYPRASKTWSKPEESLLTEKASEGYDLNELCILFGRSKHGIEYKLKYLDIDTKDL